MAGARQLDPLHCSFETCGDLRQVRPGIAENRDAARARRDERAAEFPFTHADRTGERFLAQDQHRHRAMLGAHDQMLAAPGRHTLLSFSTDTPTMAAAEIAIDIEQDELAPLFLSPFLLCDGELMWETSSGDLEDEPD